MRKLFGFESAFVASFLYSTFGFFVAFSRTIQYQSFLTLFGFLAVLFLVYYLDKGKPLLLLVSSVFLALGFLIHYDAVFFAVSS